MKQILLVALLGLGLSATGTACFAGDLPPSFYVVEIANFACSHCRIMDAELPALQAATEKAGGKFDFAPVVWGDSPAARDYVYYASRVQGAEFSNQVRTELFKAVQDQGLNFDSTHQAVEWLRASLPGLPAGTYAQLEQDAENPDIGQLAEAKAEHLADTSGVSMTPTYIFVQAGKIVTTVGYDDSQSTQALESRVLSTISAMALHPSAAAQTEGN